ncbi:MAG: cytochrome c-type biosis protein CcmF [Pseudomonadota bacterium]
MSVELGHLTLWLAVGLALLLARDGLAAGHDAAAAARSRVLARRLAALVATGYLLLTLAFARADFSVAYVAQHAHSTLPLAYRLAAVWGGHEGSLLLWITLLAGWAALLTGAGRCGTPRLQARVLGTLGAMTALLLLFLLLTSNPFRRLMPAPDEGQDLNPLLQDPGMVLHPPLLYLGYVGLVVAFAFAIAALLDEDLQGDPARTRQAWGRWARAARPWTLLAWSALTLGIALGSWWAYHELGWGGWWAFATDPARGLWLLGLMVLVVGSALALYGTRAARLGLGARFALCSRETGILLNNVVLLAAGAAVLLGTLYPMVLDALGGPRISVGAPYFETAVVPLLLPAVLLAAPGAGLRWGHHAPADLLRALRLPLLLAAVAALAQALWLGHLRWAALPGLLLAWWVAAGTLLDALARLRPLPGQRRWRTLPRPVVAMLTAHLGLAVFVLGVSQAATGLHERDLLLSVGDRVPFGGLTLRLSGLQQTPRENHEALRASVQLWQGDRLVATLQPEKRRYASSEMPMTEAAIQRRWDGDLYLALGERVEGPDGRPAWVLRAALKPWVSAIWTGCLLMAAGGLIGARARRLHRAPAAAAQEAQDARATLATVGDTHGDPTGGSNNSSTGDSIGSTGSSSGRRSGSSSDGRSGGETADDSRPGQPSAARPMNRSGLAT